MRERKPLGTGKILLGRRLFREPAREFMLWRRAGRGATVDASFPLTI
jgi:hypothetical protein